MSLRIWRVAASLLIVGLVSLWAGGARADDEDAAIAQSLAQMLRSARTVISDSQAKIDAFLPVLDKMMGSGLITVEKVQVLQYGDRKD